MPLAHIDLIKGKSPEYRQTIGNVVYDAMVQILKVPQDDRFQIIAEHDADDFVYDPHFLNIKRSPDCVFIQLTFKEGVRLSRSGGFYRKVVDDLHVRLGMRREDVFISLVPSAAEDWSFGHGEASLVR